MSKLPKIEIKTGERISFPPQVIIDGVAVPGVTGVQFEHAGMMLGRVTVTVITDDYDVAVEGLPSVRPSYGFVQDIKRARQKRRRYARCQL